MIKYLIFAFLVIQTNSLCYPHYRLIQYQQKVRHLEGPYKAQNIEMADQGGTEFNLSLWFKFEENTAIFDPNIHLTLLEFSGLIGIEKQSNHLYMENQILYFLNEQVVSQIFAIVENIWYFLIVNMKNLDWQVFLLDERNKEIFKFEKTFQEQWILDHNFTLNIGRKSSEITHFNGTYAKMELVVNYSGKDQWTQFYRGIPELIISLDFSEYELTQKFFNQIENSNYSHAINGEEEYSDIFDLDYVPYIGWSSRYGISRVKIPKFPEPETPYNHFAFFISYSVSFFNQGYLGRYHRMGLFHRMSQSNQTRFQLSIIKYDSSVENYIEAHTGLSKRFDNTAQFCYKRSYFVRIYYNGNKTSDMTLIFNIIRDSTTQINYSQRGAMISFNSTDQILLGYSTAAYSNFKGRFPLNHTFNFNSYDPILQLTFYEFQYYQGGFFKFSDAGDDLCDTNSRIEAGFDLNSQAVICKENYYSSTMKKKCLKTNALEVTACLHDMNPEDGKCFKCPRGYGNKDNGFCYKCADNCLTCTGLNPEDCTSCQIDYGFTGAYCKKCNLLLETFDSNQNICTELIDHFQDMGGEPNTVGEIQLYYQNLQGFALNQIHVENLIEKYWVANLGDEFLLQRSYQNLKKHNQVSIRLEIIVLQILQFDYMMISVDKDYKKIIPLYPSFTGYDIIEIKWGVNIKGWYFRVAMTFPHINSQLDLGIVSFYSNYQTNYWVRNIIIDFMGCYDHCLTCSKNNSPIHCQSCDDGYYIDAGECKACSIECETCVDSPENCLTFPNNSSQNIVCPVGKFYDQVALLCQVCPSECSQCSSLTECQKCINGFYLLGLSCLACQSPCLTCVETQDKCLSCITGKLLDLSTNLCIDSCQEKQYQTNNFCVSCPTGCLTCSSSGCQTCEANWYKKQQICVQNCGNNFFHDEGFVCSVCDPKCLKCTSLTSCQECNPEFFLKNNFCEACLDPCLECTESNQKCISCKEGLYLHSDSCLETCPSSFYKSNKTCQRCSEQCQECEGKNDFCLSCTPNFVKQGNQCLNKCFEQYVNFEGVCCPNTCKKCTSSENCQECQSNSFLHLNQCILCDGECLTCEIQSNKCTTCSEGFFMQNQKCVVKCDSNKFANLEKKECIKCHQKCLTCKGPLEGDCLTCFDNAAFFMNQCFDCGTETSPFDIFQGKCVDRCGDGKRFSISELPGLYNYNNCDDGNRNNGDGCDSECQVETNYICTGGTSQSKDICKEVIPPSASIQKINDESFKVTFSEKMVIKNNLSLATVFKVKILDLDESFYKVTIKEPEGEFQEISVQIEYFKTIQEKEIVFSFDIFNLNDLSANRLRTSSHRDLVSYWYPERFQIEIFANYTSQFLPPAFLSLSMGSFLIGDITSQSAFIDYSYFQEIKANYFIGAETNTTVDYYLYGLHKQLSEFYQNNVKQEGRRLMYADKYKGIRYIQSVQKDYQMRSAQNQFFLSGIFMLLLFVWSLHLFLSALVGQNFSKSTKSCLKFGVYQVERLFWVAFFINWPHFVQSTFLSLKAASFKSLIEILSVSAHFLSFLLICAFIVFFVFYEQKTDLYDIWHPNYYLRQGLFFTSFKMDQKISKRFLFVQALLQTVNLTILTFFSFSVVFQMILLLLSWLSLMGLILKYKPFINMFLHFYYVFICLLFTTIYLCYLLLLIFKERNTSVNQNLSLVICILYTLLIGFSLLKILILILIRLYYYIHFLTLQSRKKKSQNKIQPFMSKAKGKAPQEDTRDNKNSDLDLEMVSIKKIQSKTSQEEIKGKSPQRRYTLIEALDKKHQNSSRDDSKDLIV